MERGEVRWHTFKAPDKRRPVLILTRARGVKLLGDITVAPITTTVRQIRSRCILTPADGMPEICEVDLDHVMTVPKRMMGERMTRLTEAKLFEVRRALLFALGFDD